MAELYLIEIFSLFATFIKRAKRRALNPPQFLALALGARLKIRNDNDNNEKE